jgi:uncharacterized protein YhbP (UPF0306 family)
VSARWANVPRVLAENSYLVLGTADEAGEPWVTPLFYAAADPYRLYWVSAPGSRHSRNVAIRPTVAITVFDTHAPIGGAEALYLEGVAGPVPDAERAPALALLNGRLPQHQQLTADDLVEPGPLLVYAAQLSRHFVLVRGGEPGFDNVTDMRLQVTSDDDQAVGEAAAAGLTSPDG